MIFTFQSGYIQMGNVYKCIVCKNLYIPIWLYSNDYAMRYDLVLDVLYIPIWLYSNNVNFRTALNTYFFTFQSGYIQIGINNTLNSSNITLHSNLVIFKSLLAGCTFCVV